MHRKLTLCCVLGWTQFMDGGGPTGKLPLDSDRAGVQLHSGPELPDNREPVIHCPFRMERYCG